MANRCRERFFFFRERDSGETRRGEDRVGRAKTHQRNALEESKSGPASPCISFDVFLFSLSSPQHTHTHTHTHTVCV